MIQQTRGVLCRRVSPAFGARMTLAYLLILAAVAMCGVVSAHEEKGFIETAIVQDIISGSGSSGPDQLTPVGDRLFFTAWQSLSPVNREVWVTSGSGAALVFDFAGSTNPEELVEINGTVYYPGRDSTVGRELFKTTGAGVTLVANIAPGDLNSNPRGLTAAGSKLFFIADDTVNGRELWVHDTVSQQTSLLQITRGPGDTTFFINPTSGPNFAALGDVVLFVADDGISGRELWRSDGLTVQQVADINPGSGSGLSFSSDPVSVASFPNMLAVGDTLFFAADDGASGRELWKTNGQVGNATRVADIRAGSLGSDPFDFAAAGSRLVFSANDGAGAGGVEPWVSDGSSAQRLRDISPGGSSSFASFFTTVGDRVFFTASDPAVGDELWVTDGTPVGTRLAANININGDSFPSKMAAGPDGLAYFFADDGENGTELWRSNGDPEGTVLVADINPGPGSSFSGNRIAATSDRVYFEADDGSRGNELWSVVVCGDDSFNKGGGSCTARPFPPPPKIPIIMVQGKLVLPSEFKVGQNNQTGNLIYLPATGTTVRALDGTQLSPMAGNNGYGKISDVYQGEVYLAVTQDSDFDGIPDSRESGEAITNPDLDNNNTPDVNEDIDADGLTFADEFYLGTIPTVRDSDGDGSIDSIDVLVDRVGRNFTVIPLLVNIYATNGTNEPSLTDPQHIRDAIDKANIMLRGARIRLAPVGIRLNVTAGDDGTGGGFSNDGKFQEAEIFKVIQAGKLELNQLPQGRGMKLAVAHSDVDSIQALENNARGVALHGQPTVIIRQLATVELTGSTLAHEIIHTFNLEHPKEGTPEDTPGNILTPGLEGRDAFTNSTDPDKGIENTQITDGQLATIERTGFLKQWGMKGSRRSPGRKIEYAGGAIVVPAEDQLPGQPAWLDIQSVDVTSELAQDQVQFLLHVGERLPTAPGSEAVYRFLMDTDNDPGTGVMIQGVAGVDREIEVWVVGDSADGQVAVSQITQHPGGEPLLLLPPPQIDSVVIMPPEGLPGPFLDSDRILLRVYKSDLNFTDDNVTITVIAETEAGDFADSATLVYDRLRYLSDPQLLLAVESATPGQSVAFTASGLTPGETYTVTANDIVVATGTVDGSGNVDATFPAPGADREDVQFVIIMDQSMLFGESVLVVPNRIFSSGFETP